MSNIYMYKRWKNTFQIDYSTRDPDKIEGYKKLNNKKTSLGSVNGWDDAQIVFTKDTKESKACW